MIKKIILLLIVLFLGGCAKQEEAVIPEEKTCEYIDPEKDVLIYSLINDDLKKRIRAANCNLEFKNFQFGMLFKDIYDGELTDINGNTFRLSDNDEIIVEVVSSQCSHCRRQLEVINGLIEDTDIPFVQYFNVGEKDEILDLYKEENVKISDKLSIVSRDEAFKDYLRQYLKIETYPTVLTFRNGKVSFVSTGELNDDSFASLLEIGFSDPLRPEDFVDEEGNDLLKSSRSIDEVRADLSAENLEALRELDNDDYTEELTLRLMGKKVDFTKAANQPSEIYYGEVDDYTVYQDRKLAVFYTYLRDETETDKVVFINELISENEDIDYLVVLIEGLESSSSALRKMKQRFNCPVVSVLGDLPDDMFGFGIVNYPTAVFIDRGTYTGAYSNIKDSSFFGKAVDLFLSDKCIACKENNQKSNG